MKTKGQEGKNKAKFLIEAALSRGNGDNYNTTAIVVDLRKWYKKESPKDFDDESVKIV